MSREGNYHGLTKKECLFVVRNFKGKLSVWHSTNSAKTTYLCLQTEVLHPLDGKINFILFTNKSNCDHDFCTEEVPDIVKADYPDDWEINHYS